MQFIQVLLGLASAAGVLLLIWQIAIRASKYMIKHAVAPPGLKMLQDSPEGVEVLVENKDGIQLSAWHRGSGPAVVIIPESGFSASAYTPLWNLLCGYGFRVILFQSSPACMEDPELASENLERILTALAVTSPILVGHGFGAYTAFHHQSEHGPTCQTKARGIVSISGFAGNTRPFSGNKFEEIFHKISQYQKYLSAFGKDASAAGVLALQTHTNQYPWDYLTYSWNPICSFYSVGESDIPVSIIASAHDEILPFSHSADMQRVFPSAHTHTLTSGEGHMLIWEAPSLIIDEIRQMEKTIGRVQKAG